MKIRKTQTHHSQKSEAGTDYKTQFMVLKKMKNFKRLSKSFYFPLYFTPTNF
jgi:hypothetical protein